MERLKVYLAGPIRGLSFGEAIGWREQVTLKLEDAGFVCLSPMRNKELISEETKITDSYDDLVGYSAHDIFYRDKFDCQQADIIFLNLLNRKATVIGSLFELAWGYLLGKYCVLVAEKDSIYAKHPFVRVAASIIFDDLETAVDYVTSTFGSPGSKAMKRFETGVNLK